MNSLDAIIALVVLVAGIGLILTSIINEKETIFEINNIIETKTNSVICATIIDSIYSNSAKTYNEKISCIPESNKLISKKETTQKESYSITTSEKTNNIEVKTLDHYLD